MVTASHDVGPEQALRVLENSMKKRDDEIETLRQQLEQLKHELKLTSAERDHLRSGFERRSSRGESLLRSKSSEDGETAVAEPKPSYASLPGESKVKQIQDPRLGRPKRILVIGGGPAGLISLHELLNPINRPEGATLEGLDIQLYERRAEIGGVWYFEPENDIAKGWHHGPSGWQAAEEDFDGEEALLNGDAHDDDGEHDAYGSYNTSAGDMESLAWMGNSNNKSSSNNDSNSSGLVNGHIKTGAATNGPPKRQNSATSVDFCYLSEPQNAPRWPSPAYEGLVGNVLPPLIEFGAQPFPKPQNGLFPSMVETHKYLMDFGERLRPYIRTCQEITGIEPKFNEGSETISWLVTRIDWSTEAGGKESTEEWDAIITAAGAFDQPYWPETPGLAELRKQRSPLIMHAKTYPGPRPFVNQHNRFVVVGNANSANDIAAHLAPLNSSGPLYRCIRHESNFAHLPDPRIKDVAPISHIAQSADKRTLNLTLQDGTKLEGITKLIFASGYKYTFDWVHAPWIAPKNASTDPKKAPVASVSKYGAVPNLHNITFHAAAPTLAFIGLSAGSSPMPLAEIQARYVSRAWHGLLKLPGSREAMLADYAERAEELQLKDDNPEGWRGIHMVRGKPERKITQRLLDALEESEEGCSEGLFRWDEWREGVAKGMRAVKEAELRRLREAKVAAGGVDGGVGGVLSYGPVVGQRFTPVFGDKKGRGKSLML